MKNFLDRVRPITLTLAVVGIAATAHGALTASETLRVPAPASARATSLSSEDMALARTAWEYFKVNRLESGLVNSAGGFAATTMWDVASQLAGMVAAHELGLVTTSEFDGWMNQTLGALARIPLYKNELPNKAYNAAQLFPTGYGQVNAWKELGFSALDLARLALWLSIVSDRHPEHKVACHAVTARWKTGRLLREGQLMGTDLDKGTETYNQEGRLGYEQYAAHGLRKIGIDAPLAADGPRWMHLVPVEGVEIPVDVRDTNDSVAHNYVTSEPYVLDGIETGYAALPAEWAGRVLLAQTRRTRRTGIPTAWSEDNLDSAPWFVYNSIYVDGREWTTLNSSGNEVSARRGSSLKAAVGWHVLFRTADTERTFKGMRWIADPKQGAFAGYYEATDKPNRALTLNTNGIVLEALLYAHVGKPLERWAAESQATSAR